MLVAMPMIEPEGLEKIEGFVDEDGDSYAAFVDPRVKKYCVAVKASDGLAWFQIGDWKGPADKARPVQYVELMAKACLAAMEAAA